MKWGGVKRSVRVGDLIQKEIALLLHKGLKDPRLEDVSVTGVDLTGDLREAVLYFQVHGDEERIRKAVKGFRSAEPFIRTHLGKVLHIHVIPRFKFEYDATLERAHRIENLFKQIESPPPTSRMEEVSREGRSPERPTSRMEEVSATGGGGSSPERSPMRVGDEEE